VLLSSPEVSDKKKYMLKILDEIQVQKMLMQLSAPHVTCAETLQSQKKI